MSEFTARNPDYKTAVHDYFRRIGFTAHIGAKIAELAPGRCVLRMEFRPELGQQHGYFHGGIVATLADTACGHAGLTLMEADQGLITVEYKINFLAPAEDKVLEARGQVIRPGRRLFICRSDVVGIDNGRETLCATTLSSWAVVAGFGDQPRSMAANVKAVPS